MANDSNSTTYISLYNQPCMFRPNIIDLNPDEYNHGLLCYSLWLTEIDAMKVVILSMICST